MKNDEELLTEIEALLDENNDELPPEKLSPGQRVIVLSPLMVEGESEPQLVPIDGIIQVVLPTATAEWYKYIVILPDGKRGIFDAHAVKPANWIALSEFIAMPEALRDDWQDDLKSLRLTETEMPFNDWLELRHALADHILDQLSTMIDFNRLPRPVARMMDLYYNSGDLSETVEIPQSIRCHEFPSGLEQNKPEYEI